MSIGTHQSRLREGQNERPSTFDAMLRRIGLIRENSDWHRPRPLSTIAKRRNRILSARISIEERLSAYFSAVRSHRPQPRTRRLWIGVWMFIVFSVAVLALLLPSRSVQFIDERFTFPLPRTATFLSEPDGITKAREALSRVVRNPAALVPIRIDPQNSTVAPDGRRDVYLLRFNENAGHIAFVPPRHKDGLLFVELELRGDQLSCTVSGWR